MADTDRDPDPAVEAFKRSGLPYAAPGRRGKTDPPRPPPEVSGTDPAMGLVTPGPVAATTPPPVTAPSDPPHVQFRNWLIDQFKSSGASVPDWLKITTPPPITDFRNWLRGPQEAAGPNFPGPNDPMVRVPGGYREDPARPGWERYYPGRNEQLMPYREDPSGNPTAGTMRQDRNGDWWQWFGPPPANAPVAGRRKGFQWPAWLGGGPPAPAPSGWMKMNRTTGEWEPGTPPKDPPETGPTGKTLVKDPNAPGGDRTRYPGDTGERPDIPGRPDLNRLTPEERRRYPPPTGMERDPRSMGGGRGGGPFGGMDGMGGMGGPMGMGNPFAAFLSRMGGGGVPYGLFGVPGPYAGTSNILPGYPGEGGGGGYTGYGEGQYDPAGGGGGDNIPPGASPVAPGGAGGGVPAAAPNPAPTTPPAAAPGGAGAIPAPGAPGGGAAPSVPVPAAPGGAPATAPAPRRGFDPLRVQPFTSGAADGGAANVAAAGLPAYARADTARAGVTDGWGSYNPATRGAQMAVQRNQTLDTVGSTLTQAGLPPSAVNAIWANVISESAGNPTLRHPDQPRWGGEAHYAHGLYQEGGAEWNRYAQWLNGRDWRDPALQTQFLAANIQTRYPRLWSKLMDPNRSQEQKAVDFMAEYLRPAGRYQATRSSQYRRGIPNAWTSPAEATTA